MEFGEKLLSLRKKESMSQEDLAEKLNTSRQAISKWENGQGFPETEKLLKIGNLFNVSVDYLLKDSVENKNESKGGYYVSKEMAEGFLQYEAKATKNAFIGISTIIFSYIPYLIFKSRFEIYVILVSLTVVLGIGFFLKAVMIEDNYKILKEEVLIFDERILKEINEKYNNIKNKYNTLIIMGACSLFLGATIALLLKRGMIENMDTTIYQVVSAFFISIGFYITGYFTSILESYCILVKNNQHLNKISFKFIKKLKERIS